MNVYHVFFGNFGSLSNSSGYVSAFAYANAYPTFMITQYNQGLEAESSTTLNNPSNSVYINYALVELLFFKILSPTTLTSGKICSGRAPHDLRRLGAGPS